MTVNPCRVGLICPFEHYDEDGMALCSYPDIEPRRRKAYPLIIGMDDECDLYPNPESPLYQLIKVCERIGLERKPQSYLTWRTVKVTVEIRGADE